MASVDYTYFTDADMPQENMKDWHTCLKAKTNQPFFFKNKKKTKHCFLCYSHMFVSVCFVFLHQHTSLFVWRTCPFLLYECMFVFICAYTLQIYHVCVAIVYREGSCSSRAHWTARQFLDLIVRNPCMYHSVSLYTSTSVTFLLYVTPLFILHL